MTTDQLDRFLCKIALAPNGCWAWTASCDREGYAQFKLAGRMQSGHVVAYRYFIGEIAFRLTLDHLCRNRACVNPTHVEPVTQRENVLRGNAPTAVHARKTHCRAGHPLSGVNLRIESGGGRRCLACMHAAQARWYARQQQPSLTA